MAIMFLGSHFPLSTYGVGMKTLHPIQLLLIAMPSTCSTFTRNHVLVVFSRSTFAKVFYLARRMLLGQPLPLLQELSVRVSVECQSDSFDFF